jgi:hypothetical protein
MKLIVSLLFLFFTSQDLFSQKQAYKIYTLAFYNLENLFDTIDHPEKLDEESPLLKIQYNRSKIYAQKLKNMAHVISEIGLQKTGSIPTLVGVAEIENNTVLEDLLQTPPLKEKNYGFLHFDSPDMRGIDVALLYQKTAFVPLFYKNYTLKLWTETGMRIHTRDVLLVSGYLDNELLHILVNHWPSRRGGEKKSRHLRERAAFLNKKISDSLFADNPQARIIIMGDFNDNPTSSSFKKILKTKKKKNKTAINEFYNPFELLYKKGMGTLAYRDKVHLFDQILISGGLLSKNKSFENLGFFKSHIFNPHYLTSSSGRYKNYPYRSFVNGGFTNGYSDHYPVYINLIKMLKF